MDVHIQLVHEQMPLEIPAFARRFVATISDSHGCAELKPRGHYRNPTGAVLKGSVGRMESAWPQEICIAEHQTMKEL